MKRIVKFRGKRKGGTEWFFGDLDNIGGEVYIFDRSDNAPLNSPDWFMVDPETVGQFTGLTDKNGKEIYEGDILRAYKPNSYLRADKNFVVRWHEDEAAFKYYDREGEPVYKFQEKLYNIGNNKSGAWCEIIGNIHDNPNLL